MRVCCLSLCLQYSPPLIPPRGEVNAADAFDIGSFDEEDTKGIKVKQTLTLPGGHIHLGIPIHHGCCLQGAHSRQQVCVMCKSFVLWSIKDCFLLEVNI